MISARSRDRPNTGRSNLGFRGSGRDVDIENNNPQQGRSTSRSESIRGSARPNSGAESEGSHWISTARRIELNNPLEVFCPFEPELKLPSCELSRPPILPRNRYQTVYAEEPPKRPIKPYTPKEYVEALQKPNLYEEIDMASFEDEQLRKKLTKEFIDRNQSRLWKFNLDYAGKDPRQVYHELLKSDSLISTLKAYGKREASICLGGSEKVKINLSDVGYNSLGEVRNDYALNSLTTSRRSRNEKIERLLMPSEGKELIRTNVRGYKHTPEYGNFSTYTSYMNLNAATALNR